MAMASPLARRPRARSPRRLAEFLEPRRLLSGASLESIHVQSTHVLREATPAASTAFTPAQIKQAYGFNQVQFSGVAGDGRGQTIAIVDAYDDPLIASDLSVFDQRFGIAPPPNFSKVYASGAVPKTDAGWSVEIALDVEWAHAIAPAANIVLVEARSDNLSDLLTAVNVARNLPSVNVISMSWGGDEFAGKSSNDNVFTTPAGHQGITFVAAAGDQGTGAIWPAASPNVLAVGGTSLSLSSGIYIGEAAWSGSGGGESVYESEPAFQRSVQSSGARTLPDVAYDANPNTGFQVYDSVPTSSGTPGGWMVVGGTSAGAPQWAALAAIADQGRAATGQGSLANMQSLLYQLPASDFHDVLTGSDGLSATAGYDLVTGRGSPIAGLIIPALVGIPATSGSGGSGGSTSNGNSGGLLPGGGTGGLPTGLPANLNNVATELTHSASYYSTFISHAYATYLERAPDLQGLAWWTAQMQAGATDEQLEADLISSTEYLQRHGGTAAGWVAGMYSDLLQRSPDLFGQSYWLGQLQAGVGRGAIALQIAASAEREAMVVNSDYFTYLGRTASALDIQYWNLRFQQGAHNEDIVAGFIASPEYYNSAAKGQGARLGWVDSVFHDLYERSPTAGEANFWLGQLG